MEGDRRPAVLVVGVGNRMRGDDAVGGVVARRLGERALSGVRTLCFPSPADLPALWRGCDRVVVIDAAGPAGAPGSIRSFDAGGGRLPARSESGSTHGLGLAEAIELSRVLAWLPRRLAVHTIEGRDFEPGAGLSLEVERAAGVLVGRLAAELARRAT